MIAVFVTFRYGTDFNEEIVRSLAEGSRANFEGMPGLHQKTSTVDPVRREATNVYIWKSEEAAQAFFTTELVGRVTQLYGVQPTIEFAQIAALVENS